MPSAVDVLDDGDAGVDARSASPSRRGRPRPTCRGRCRRPSPYRTAPARRTPSGGTDTQETHVACPTSIAEAFEPPRYRCDATPARSECNNFVTRGATVVSRQSSVVSRQSSVVSSKSSVRSRQFEVVSYLEVVSRSRQFEVGSRSRQSKSPVRSQSVDCRLPTADCRLADCRQPSCRLPTAD